MPYTTLHVLLAKVCDTGRRPRISHIGEDALYV